MKKLLTILFAVALGLNLSAQTVCSNPQDANQDGVIGVDDLMDLLSHWGDTDSDFDGVYDSVDLCTDEGACNYSANPTEPCAYVYDALGICGGDCPTDEDEDGVCDFDCGEHILHEGYNYSTVQIGEQCWFSENCRYLPEVSPSSEGNTTDPYYYVYGYEGTDVASAMSTSNYATYGVLYNWPAVMTEGVCPSHWHIPSYEEFIEVINLFGGSETTGGSSMKSTFGWNSGNWNSNGNGSNLSGFTGLPGGQRSANGSLEVVGGNGTWWSSSAFGANEKSGINLRDHTDGIHDYHSGLSFGISARCIKD